ncbi:hypothetical protein BG000_002594 [Podila horticola]|nr:hypothetical protein BG000_002594 [Podila horticola]
MATCMFYGWHPLRIKCDPETVYTVIYSNIFQRSQAEDSHIIEHERDNLDQGNSQYPEQGDPLELLKQLNDTCAYLYKYLETFTSGINGRFRQASANARYYHLLLVEEIERLDQTGVKVLVDGKDQEQLLEELRDSQEKAKERLYQNTCYSTLFETFNKWDFATSSLLIVLPIDLDTWDDSDPSTHRLRLHYMCDNWIQEGALKEIPQHIHLSNHPGYNIKQPQESLKVYGDYFLRMLLMIKHGFFDGHYDIPPLDTFKILWNCDLNVIGSHLTKDTIRPLVDKAITYLQELSPLKWKGKLGLNQIQSNTIKTHLCVQDGDNTESYLHRYLNERQCIHWKCQAHAHQYLNRKSLDELKKFVSGHGGYVDMQQARLGVELKSSIEADQFRSLLAGPMHTFDMSIKLGWEATRSYVKDLSMDIANTGTVVLELDGIMLEWRDIIPIVPGLRDVTPMGYGQSLPFLDEIMNPGKTRFVRLLNYPRPQEQCILLNKFSLQSVNSTAQFPHSWIELHNDLRNLVDAVQNSSAWNEVPKALQSTLEKYGLAGTTEVTMYNDGWNAVFDRISGALVEVHSLDKVCPEGVFTAGTIKTLEVHVPNLQVDEDFFQAVQINDSLQELTISYLGHNILYYTGHIANMWRTSARSICIKMLDHLEDTRGRVVAQLAISGSDVHHPGNSILDKDGYHTDTPVIQQQAGDAPLDLEFLQWKCDHAFYLLSDYSASFLNVATYQHPSVLTMFELDVSHLTCHGLASVQKILHRSSLEHLVIRCIPFELDLSDSVAKVLGAVSWSTLKYLVLSGIKLNEWIAIWPFTTALQLQCLQIRGTSKGFYELSHSSVLFVHQLLSTSPLAELHLVDVQLQDGRDWVLLISSIDLSLLQTLDLGEHGVIQFLSVPDAVDLFVSELEATHLETNSPKLILPSFILDTSTLPQSSLAHVRTILSRCILEKLVVQCDTIGLNVSDPIAKVLESVQWTMLVSLTLSGDNINQWVQLLAKFDEPRLKSLQIRGKKSVQQELSHESVLFFERLIGTSSRMKLHFKHVLLHDQCDWVILVDKMDPSALDDFDLGDGTYKQFMSTTDAVDIMRSKRSQLEDLEVSE